MTELAMPGQLAGLNRAMLQAVDAQDGATAGEIVTTLGSLVQSAENLKLKTAKYNYIVEQHFWAARELGLLLEEICPHGGTRPSKHTLGKLDISDRLSKFARSCARVDKEDARVYFDETNTSRANISHMLKITTEMNTDPPDPREKVIGKLAQMLKLSKDVRDSYEATQKERDACVMFEEGLS